MKRVEVGAALRRDPAIFFEAVLRTLHPQFTPLTPWYVETIIHHCLNGKAGHRLITVALPPLSLKSTLCSVALPALLIGRLPGFRVLVCAADRAAARRIQALFTTTTTSPWYQHAFGGTRFAERKSRGGATSRMPSFTCITTRDDAPNSLFDLIVIDDPYGGTAANPIEFERVNALFDQALMLRVRDPADPFVLAVMTRAGTRDLHAHLRLRRNATALEFPAIATERSRWPLLNGTHHIRRIDEVLAPEIHSSAALERVRLSMTRSEFNQRFQQDVSPPPLLAFGDTPEKWGERL